MRFLPSSIATQFGTLSNGFNTGTGLGGTAVKPTQTITVNTINTNNVDLANPFNFNDICTSVGVPCLRINRALTRGVFTLEGRIDDNWSWKAYAQHGQVRERQVAAQDSFGPRYNLAIDAVKVTPTNQGTSGLPIGSIQCRGLLNPAALDAASAPFIKGCQPLDIFGNNVASQGAILYVNPGRDSNSGILNQELIILNQDVFSGSIQGELPWGLPAGNIAMVIGGEYRHEQGSIPYADPYGAQAAYAAGNFRPYRGQYDTKEGFIEVDAPILKDQFVENLSLNMAGRMTDYSTSGLVETWKLGLTSQIDDNIRLRGTWSLDIRAPPDLRSFRAGGSGDQPVPIPPRFSELSGDFRAGRKSQPEPGKGGDDVVWRRVNAGMGAGSFGFAGLVQYRHPWRHLLDRYPDDHQPLCAGRNRLLRVPAL